MQHHHGGAPPPPPPPQPGHGGVYAEPPRQKDGIPYIGSRISLISKTDIRYEGFLFNIDTQQSMVALQHVRSFGTEGRRPDHIPPSDQVLPYATFKAQEIKDLHVCEAAPPVYGYAPPPPMPPPMPHQQYHPHGGYAQPPLPPGPPVSAPPQPPMPPPSAPPQPRQPPMPSQSSAPKPASPAKQAKPVQASAPTLLTPGSVSNANSSARPARPQPPVPQQQQQYQQPPQQQKSPPSSPRRVEEVQRANNAASRTIPGMGDHLLKRKERRVPGGTDDSVSTGLDFNFEQGLIGFDKEEEFSKLDINDNKAKGSYQKSSFFDTISCDALDRLEGKHNRFSSGQERKLNTETFGAVGLNNNRRSFRGGRGGGGRGRRGRGRSSGSWDGRPREANN